MDSSEQPLQSLSLALAKSLPSDQADIVGVDDTRACCDAPKPPPLRRSRPLALVDVDVVHRLVQVGVVSPVPLLLAAASNAIQRTGEEPKRLKTNVLESSQELPPAQELIQKSAQLQTCPCDVAEPSNTQMDTPPDLDMAMDFAMETPPSAAPEITEALALTEGGSRPSSRSKASGGNSPTLRFDASGPAITRSDQQEVISSDEFLARLMERRALRQASQGLEAEDVASAARNGTPSRVRESCKLQAQRDGVVDLRALAASRIQEQLHELRLVSSTAQACGWWEGCLEDVRVLETPPPLCRTPPEAKANATSGRGRNRLTPMVEQHRRHEEPFMNVIVLEPTVLRTDAACAARATDLWEREHRSLLKEAARAYRHISSTKRPQNKATSKASMELEEARALDVLTRLRNRARDEPSRRVLMRRCGACPKAVLCDTDRRAGCRTATEGTLAAWQVVSNEFEATTFLPSGELAARLKETRPGLLQSWHEIDVNLYLEPNAASRAKDFRVCTEIAQGFGAEVVGSFVGRLARNGFTQDYPFLIRAGLDHFVCVRCERWVPRRFSLKHAACCEAAVAIAAKNGGCQMRVFRQHCGEDLGLNLRYKHSPQLGVVELQGEVPMGRIVRRACWACFWTPSHLSCAWRLAQRCSFEDEAGAFPANSFPPPEAEAREAKYTRRRKISGDEASGSEEAGSDFQPKRHLLKGAVAFMDDTGGISKHKEDRISIEMQVANMRPERGFVLKNSLSGRPASQPRFFLRPLSSAQLHSLGWMMQQEARTTGHTSNHVLRQPLAETDVCFEVRFRRVFDGVRGGILGDQLGYGKTACMIGLIAETKDQSVMESLSLSEWPEIAGRRILTPATLVVTPPNLFEQWLREFRKFVSHIAGLRVLAVTNHQKLRSLTIADFVAADVILVSFRFFFSGAYQRYFDELAKPGLAVWDKAALQQPTSPQPSIGRSSLETCARHRGRVGRSRPNSGCGPLFARGHSAFARARTSRTNALRRIASAQKTHEECVKTELVGESTPFELDGKHERERAENVKKRRPPPVAPPRLSRYYLELQNRKDYVPQRYLDLERRTQRLLREVDAEELARGPALFEMFFFKRVVFDEFHEVARASVQQAMAPTTGLGSVPFYALHALQGRCHWGLTATPLLSSASSVAHMASLLRVFVPHDDFKEAQRFLDEWVTSNTWDVSDVALEEHWIEVELTGAERVLYLDQRNVLAVESCAGSGTCLGVEARARERRLLQFCSHFDPARSLSDPGGELVGHTDVGVSSSHALALMDRTLMRHQSALERVIRRIQELDVEREELFDRCSARDILHDALPGSAREANLICAHSTLLEIRRVAEAAAQSKDGMRTGELVLVEGDLRRLAQRVLASESHAPFGSLCEACGHLAQWEERVKQLNRSRTHAISEQRQCEQRLRFFQAVVACVSRDDSHENVPNLVAEDCSLCLRSIGKYDGCGSGARAILPCGHQFHEACVQATIVAKSCCPTCQNPTSIEMLSRVDEHLSMSIADPMGVKFGSKIAKVIETISIIQREEGEATKCVIFIQWDALAAHLERALVELKLPPLVLRGSLVQRQKTISKFADDKTRLASILLLSLEKSPVGMNLVCARHVLLVHPMYADHAEDAVSYEIQAVGRVWRQGQMGRVHVYRFVASDTVEEELSRRHHGAFLQHRCAMARKYAEEAAQLVEKTRSMAQASC